MAEKGKTDKIGGVTAEEEKDFKGEGVEGKKSNTEIITCETVINNLRKKKYPI